MLCGLFKRWLVRRRSRAEQKSSSSLAMESITAVELPTTSEDLVAAQEQDISERLSIVSEPASPVLPPEAASTKYGPAFIEPTSENLSAASQDCEFAYSAAEPSLVKLPTEVLMLIIPDPFKLHGIKVDDDSVTEQRWLAIKHDWKVVKWCSTYGHYRTAGPHYTLQDLRALSRTCRRLRALTLPLLWACVHLKSVNEMGRLCQALREAPYVVPLIRHFAFLWDMNEDCWSHDHAPSEYETFMELAFVDRGELWERKRQKLNSPEIKCTYGFRGARTSAYFTGDGGYHHEPGHEPLREDLIGDEQEIELMSERKRMKLQKSQWGRQSPPYGPYCGPNLDRSGPDGRGADPRINNEADFNTCLGEIVSRLTSIEVFVWASAAAPPMPLCVLDALKRATKLRKLHLFARQAPKMKLTEPLWELASQLESLSLESRTFICRFGLDCDSRRRRLQETGEVTEEELARVDRDSEDHDVVEPLDEHYSIVYRIIAAAAKSGKLRRLIVPEQSVQKPFAVREFVPCWIDIEEWRVLSVECRSDVTPITSWSDAASALRPALAHVSIWLPEPTPGSRNDRLLTLSDVQSLYAYFQDNTPDFTDELRKHTKWRAQLASWSIPTPDRVLAMSRSVVDLYLPWLAQDAKLAQRVADAWNAVVERKEVNVVRCRCKMCIDA